MRRVMLLLLLSVVLGGSAYFLSRPATVNIGLKEISIKESRGYVYFMNLVGDFKGIGRCEITGLSWYWVPYSALKFNEHSGVMFSDYAIEVLLHMDDQREAYRIAQGAFDRLQERCWIHNKGNKLLFPLELIP